MTLWRLLNEDMKIGVMLRNLNEKGGIVVYTVNLLRELLRIDQGNEYYFLYNDSNLLGRYSQYKNVREIVLSAPNKLLWDQVAVPRAARRYGFDLIFNPKLSVPLLGGTRSVFVLHGAEQFAVAPVFKWHDRIYVRLTMPLFCRKAAAIISTTYQGRDEIARYLKVDRRKIHPIYESYNELCRPMSAAETEPVRRRYDLPERFALFVGGLSPLKNFGNTLRAYRLLRQEFDHKLVVVGFLRWKFQKDLELINELGLRDEIRFTGFVPDEDIPAFYNLADLLVFPSLYEGFGIPALEAMACGCPVVTTRTGCTPEVAGDAAILVDPYSPANIFDGMRQILLDNELRGRLRRRGFERVKHFSWEKCAGETLALFRSLGEERHEKEALVLSSAGH